MEPVQVVTEMGWPAALAGAICFMFHQYALAQTSRISALEKLTSDLLERAQKCEDDRADMRRQNATVETQLNELRLQLKGK